MQPLRLSEAVGDPLQRLWCSAIICFAPLTKGFLAAGDLGRRQVSFRPRAALHHGCSTFLQLGSGVLFSAIRPVANRLRTRTAGGTAKGGRQLSSTAALQEAHPSVLAKSSRQTQRRSGDEMDTRRAGGLPGGVGGRFSFFPHGEGGDSARMPQAPRLKKRADPGRWSIWR